MQAARESEAVHAYRDATSAGRQALELWRDDEDAGERRGPRALCALCAELAGQLSEAIKGWRELAAIRSAGGEPGLRGRAAAARAVYELGGEREPAFAARRLAVQAFSASGRPADAAIERLSMANHRRIGAKYSDALELARAAAEEATAAERPTCARALGSRAWRARSGATSRRASRPSAGSGTGAGA